MKILFYIVVMTIILANPLSAQRVGINSESPKAGLHVASEDGLMAEGTLGSGIVPDSGVGTRLVWIPFLSAFRAGTVNTDYDNAYEDVWDPVHIGIHSVATGLNTRASGYGSWSHGDRNVASGTFSVSIGGAANVSSGHNSLTAGMGVTAPSFGEMAFGTYNLLYTPISPNTFEAADRIFTIGCGSGEMDRKNALTVTKSGRIGLFTASPQHDVDIDGRLNIRGNRLNFSETGGSVWIGEDAGANETDGGFPNVLIGAQSGAQLTTGEGNISLGFEAFSASTSGSYNIALGNQALRFTQEGIGNIGIGKSALYQNSSGSHNIALGFDAMRYGDSTHYNTAISESALRDLDTGEYNIGIGRSSLLTLVSGSDNVAIGAHAGSGGNFEKNTFIGSEAGRNATGSSNVFLGNQAGYNSTRHHSLYIDNSDTETPLILGDFATNKVVVHDSLESKYLTVTEGAAEGHVLTSDAFGHASWSSISGLSGWTWDDLNLYNANAGNVGIGTTDPMAQLHVAGSIVVDTGGIAFIHSGNSVFVGQAAGENDDRTDNRNVFMGHQAGATNISGEHNIGIGYQSVDGSAEASFNIGIGSLALTNASLTGQFNVGLGYGALEHNTSGENNIGVGQNALGQNQSGIYNLAIGPYSLDANQSGGFNIAIGAEALGQNTSGEKNIAIGYNSMKFNTGSTNTAVGYEAGFNNSGSGNVFLGHRAGLTASGSNQLYISNNSSNSPLIHGNFSTKKVTINDSLSTKYFQLSQGIMADGILKSDTQGRGTWTPRSTLFQDDDLNVLIGEEAGQDLTTGNANTVMGAFAGAALTTGYENTAIGETALSQSLEGDFNTAIGRNALGFANTGDNNTAVGWGTLAGTTGGNNAGLGAEAGGNNLTGSRNVFVGTEAGRENQGSDNVFIGYRAGKNEAGNNKLYIDNTDTSTPLIQGDFSTNTVSVNNTLGVSTTDPKSTMDVNGSVGAKFRTPLVAGTTNPDATGMVWRYNSGTGTITLPGAGTCPNRIYVIINQTGSTRTISTYRDLVTVNQTTIGSSVALWLMSDGAEWWQIK